MPKLIPEKKLRKLETSYVTGSDSLRELAKKNGVPYKSVARHSKDGGWVEKRNRYRAGVVSDAIDACARKDVDRLQRAGDAADRLIAAIYEMSGSMEKLCTHLLGVTHGPDSDTEERVLSILNIPNLRGMAQTLKDLTEVLARVDRIPTVREQTDRERLELERRRFDAQEQQKEQDATIRVVFEDDLNDEGADG